MLRRVHAGALSTSPDFLSLGFSVCLPMRRGTILMLWLPSCCPRTVKFLCLTNFSARSQYRAELISCWQRGNTKLLALRLYFVPWYFGYVLWLNTFSSYVILQHVLKPEFGIWRNKCQLLLKNKLGARCGGIDLYLSTWETEAVWLQVWG
jgi:hypothetical protein